MVNVARVWMGQPNVVKISATEVGVFPVSLAPIEVAVSRTLEFVASWQTDVQRFAMDANPPQTAAQTINYPRFVTV